MPLLMRLATPWGFMDVPDARKVQGLAAGVDESGALLLRDAQSSVETYSGGEVSLRLDAAR